MANYTSEIKTDDIEALRKIQLHLLDSLDAICKKHNLIYWLDFGTLLGAVRNGKFIPWDDDIDVSMSTDSYKKFLEIAQSELPENIFLQTPKTDPEYKQCFIKLRDNNSTFIELHEKEGMNYHQGIFIDIFPVALYPKMPRLFQKVLMRTTVRSYGKAFIHRKYPKINFVIYYFCKFIWLLLSPLKKVGYGQIPEDNGYMYAVPLEFLHPLTTIKFENKDYPAPNNYHGHLAVMYGKNYITPPPEKNRVPHAKLILPHTPYKHPKI